MLLLEAGGGEATCGILYLASFLRRHGVEAFVRLTDGDATDEAMKASLAGLVSRVRPAIVGISLKWYHHVHRALVVARILREVDPELIIVAGGNTASSFWRELMQLDAFDHVILGDGEAPLLALCRGDAAPPNAVCRAAAGSLVAPRFDYVQDASSGELFYSHCSELFLSEADLRSFSGWIAPGKGCDQTCLYCGGSRAAQESAFGRGQPFLRAEALTRRDHEELLEIAWQLRYDFPGGSSLHLVPIWKALDLTRHSATYFLWGAPQRGLVEALSETFARAYLVLDIGCFSETQRRGLTDRGLLKRCPSSQTLLEVVDACRRHGNLRLEVSGIAGLPLTSRRALDEESALSGRTSSASWRACVPRRRRRCLT